MVQTTFNQGNPLILLIMVQTIFNPFNPFNMVQTWYPLILLIMVQTIFNIMVHTIFNHGSD